MGSTRSMITTLFIVRGKVQGVGFRWWTKETARGLGLVGYVKNRSDGSVEVLAQGDSDSMATLATLLREGPQAANVTELSKADVTSIIHSTFEIAR